VGAGSGRGARYVALIFARSKARQSLERVPTSILVEHLLDLVGLGRPGQSQLQKDARFLRAQVVGGDKARLLPVVVADHPAGADPGAAHDDNAGGIKELLEAFLAFWV
jgi:hypothetical protein